MSIDYYDNLTSFYKLQTTQMIRITPDMPQSVMSNVRFCIHCKHARRIDNPYKFEVACMRFKTIDLVTGIPSYDHAIDVRKNEQMCGFSGRLFEPYEKADFSEKETTTDKNKKACDSEELFEESCII